MKIANFDSLTDREKEKIGTIVAFIIVIIWGYSFVAVKNVVEYVPPFYTVAIRKLGGALFLHFMFFRRMLKTSIKDVMISIPIGLALFSGFALQTSSSQYMEAGKVAFYTGSMVVFVPFFAWIIAKRKPTNTAFVGAFIAFLGLSVLTFKDVGVVEIADITAILCAVMFALHIVLISISINKISSIRLAVLQIYISGFTSLLFAIFIEEPPDLLALPSGIINSLIYLSVACTGIAYLLQNIAQKFITPSKASLIMSLESFLGAFFGIIFLSEPLTVNLAVGGILIFLAILISERGNDIFAKFYLVKKK